MRLGQDAERAEHSHVVGSETDVLISLRSSLGGKIERVFGCKARERCSYLVPLLIAGQAATLAPLVGGEQAEMPVGQFKRRIDGLGRTQSLLRGNHTLESITVVVGVICCKRFHEAGGLFDLSGIFLYDTGPGIGAVKEFGKINEVRLLPYEERANLGWSLNARGVGHLHPAHTFKALTASYLAGDRHDGLIPGESAGQKIFMTVERELGLMPPYHLEMEFSKPGVVSQTCLLGRGRTGTLCGKKILRQHDSALQLGSTGVGAFAEIDHTARTPEIIPITSGFLSHIGGGSHTGSRLGGSKLGSETPGVGRGTKHPLVAAFDLGSDITGP